MKPITILALSLSLAASGAAAGELHSGAFHPPGPGIHSMPAMKPMPSTPSMSGGDTFKPFKGVHTESTRGGVDPYPAAPKPKTSKPF